MLESAQSWHVLSNAFKQTSENNKPDFEFIKKCIKQVIAKETIYCESALLV